MLCHICMVLRQRDFCIIVIHVRVMNYILDETICTPLEVSFYFLYQIFATEENKLLNGVDTIQHHLMAHYTV